MRMDPDILVGLWQLNGLWHQWYGWQCSGWIVSVNIGGSYLHDFKRLCLWGDLEVRMGCIVNCSQGQEKDINLVLDGSFVFDVAS